MADEILSNEDIQKMFLQYDAEILELREEIKGLKETIGYLIANSELQVNFNETFREGLKVLSDEITKTK